MALIFGSAIVSYPLTTCARRPLFPLDLTAATATLIALPGVSIPNAVVGCCALCVFCSTLALAPGSDTRCCDRVSSVLVRRFVILRAPAVAEAVVVVVAYASFTARRNSFVTNSRGHACHGCRVGVVVVVVLDNICEELFWSVVQWSQKFVTRILNYVILM